MSVVVGEVAGTSAQVVLGKVAAATPGYPVVLGKLVALQLGPSADTYVSQIYPGNNYGTGTSAGIFTSSVGYISSVPLLKFDLSGLAGKTIVSAELHLYQYNTDSAGRGATYRVHPVLVPWTETGATFDSPGDDWLLYTSHPENFGAQCGSLTEPSANSAPQWRAWNIDPAAIQGRVDGTVTDYGLTIRQTDYQQGWAGGIAFYTREAAGSRPYLLVNYI